MHQRPPLPPFSLETAVEKVRKAENAWNTRDPAQVALAYSADSIWRNQAEFLVGRDAISLVPAVRTSRPSCSSMAHARPVYRTVSPPTSSQTWTRPI